MDLEKLKEARNNRKKCKIKTTYTTGNPYYNIKMFNKRMGTDFNNPSTAEAQKAAIQKDRELSIRARQAGRLEARQRKHQKTNEGAVRQKTSPMLRLRRAIF